MCRSASRSHESLGAEVANVNEIADVSGWFHDANEGAGLDVVFEMSGAPAAVRDAFRIVRNGGDVVLFGIPSSPVELDIAESLIFKNLHVTAVNGREVFATWYRTRWLLEHGVVDLRPLVTHRYPITEFEVAFAELESGNACKIVLHPGGDPAMPLVRATPTARRRAGADAERARQMGAPVSAPARFGAELDALRAAGTLKHFNTLLTPQGPVVEMAGRGEVIVLSSNNYLGLANDPRVVEAGIDGPAPLRRRNRVGALHLRHVPAAPRARARARGAVGHRGRAHLRLLLERERGARPDAHRREHGDPLGRAEPRLDRRCDPACQARAEGDLPALGPRRAPAGSSPPASRASASS